MEKEKFDQGSKIQRIIEDLQKSCSKSGDRLYVENDKEKTALLFVQLADVLSGESQENKETHFCQIILHKAILLNAAFCRTNKNDFKQEISKSICDLFHRVLSKSGKHETNEQYSKSYISDVIKGAKDMLMNSRMNAAANIESLTSFLKSFKKDDANFKIERLKKIQEIFYCNTEDYVTLMEYVSKECIEMLGDPPCEFAHLAMGSLHKGTITPYSDLDSAIVFEDSNSDDLLQQRQIYFRGYAVLFQLIIIGLGETPVRLGGIKCLNDFYDSTSFQNDWFGDDVTPCGIRFNSQIPFAGKSPFSKTETSSKENEVELIGTTDCMLRHLDKENILKEGYHLADVLSQTSLISGNKSVFEEFSGEATKKMNLFLDTKEGFDYFKSQFNDDIKRYSIETKTEKIGTTKNIKNSFYQPFSVFFSYLEHLTGLHISRSWIQIKDFWIDNGMSATTALNLIYAYAVANEVRLRLYLEQKQHSDVVAGTPYVLRSEDINEIKALSIFDVIDKSDIVCIYQMGISWSKALMEISSLIENRKSISEIQRDVIDCLNVHLQIKHPFYLEGLILQHFIDYNGAQDAFIKALNNADSADVSYVISLYKELGRCSQWSLSFRDAAKYLEKAIGLIENNPADQKKSLAELCFLLGQAYTEINKPKARLVLEKSEHLWKELQQSEPDNLDYLKGFAEVIDSTAWLCFNIGDFETSLEKYRDSLQVFQEFYRTTDGQIPLNNDIFKTSNGVALCLHALKRYDEALLAFQEVISLKHKIIGKQAADVNVAMCKRKIGDCYTEVGDFQNAEASYLEAIKIREAGLGSEQEKNCSLANTTYNLAECYLRFNWVSKAATSARRSFMLSCTAHQTTNGPKIMRKAVHLLIKIVDEYLKSNNVVERSGLVSCTQTSIQEVNSISNCVTDVYDQLQRLDEIKLDFEDEIVDLNKRAVDVLSLRKLES